jgi:hypothetical protein
MLRITYISFPSLLYTWLYLWIVQNINFNTFNTDIHIKTVFSKAQSNMPSIMSLTCWLRRMEDSIHYRQANRFCSFFIFFSFLAVFRIFIFCLIKKTDLIKRCTFADIKIYRCIWTDVRVSFIPTLILRYN